MTRRFLVTLLARLDASPLPIADPVRVALEWEVLQLLAAHAETVRAIPAARRALASPTLERQ
jgi:hypothetical protein